MYDAFHDEFAQGPSELGSVDECPRCNYCLDGLPDRCACPECGLSLDRQWRVFGGAIDVPTRLGGLTSADLVFVPRWFWASLIAIPWLFTLIDKWPCARTIVLVLLVLSVSLTVLLNSLRRRRFVALTDAGILVDRGGSTPDCIPWAEVELARYDYLRQSLNIQMHGTIVRLKTSHYFGGDLEGVFRCIDAINTFPR
jgi:hypothetical protein